MAKRPALTEDSFLKHLFSPKKNPLPTGIRKKTLKPARGRTRARVAAFNRMSPANQELLQRAGLREAYLRGEAATKDARTNLRAVAVTKGHARPLRVKATIGRVLTNLDARVAVHTIKVLRDDGKPVDIDRLYKGIPYLPEEDKEMLVRASIGRVKAYAGDSSKLVDIEGQTINPLWYHPS